MSADRSSMMLEYQAQRERRTTHLDLLQHAISCEVSYPIRCEYRTEETQ